MKFFVIFYYEKFNFVLFRKIIYKVKELKRFFLTENNLIIN